MPPSTRVRKAEDAARKLTDQLRSPVMLGMLQHAPPVGFPDRQQAVQLPSIWTLQSQLVAALKETGSAETVQVLSALLRQQAARSVGTLVAWAQQQPDQLYTMAGLNALAPQGHSPGAVVLNAAGTSWWSGLEVLDRMLVSAITLDSSSTSAHQIVTTMTEQLEQSGKGLRAQAIGTPQGSNAQYLEMWCNTPEHPQNM
jgi:hypothetical protein